MAYRPRHDKGHRRSHNQEIKPHERRFGGDSLKVRPIGPPERIHGRHQKDGGRRHLEMEKDFMPGITLTNLYRGVHQCRRLIDDRWLAYYCKLRLGNFNTPEEAAIAHNHAALLLGRDTSPPNIVPLDRLPSPERQAAIRSAVEKCVHRTGLIKQPNGLELAPVQRKPGRVSSTSGYIGVSWQCQTEKWRPQIYCHGHQVSLGVYNSEHEGALAYNHAVQLVGDQRILQNVIPPESLPLPERCIQIQGLVEQRLQRSGVLAPKADSPDRSVSISRISKTGYRGVSENSSGRQWNASIIHKKRFFRRMRA